MGIVDRETISEEELAAFNREKQEGRSIEEGRYREGFSCLHSQGHPKKPESFYLQT
jgi:hypothetical protein